MWDWFFGGSSDEVSDDQDLALMIAEGALDDMMEQDDAPTQEQFDAISDLSDWSDCDF
jgi:hypothetical protein